MAGGGQMGGGQPPSGGYGSPNFDSSNPVNQPPSGSGMKPPMGGLGTMGMAGMGAAGAMPQNMGGAMQPGESNAVDTLYRNIYNRPASADELSFYKNEFGDDVSSEEAQSLRQRLEESRGTESITPQQPSAYDTAYPPRYNYMYGNPMANPFGGGMNPFYGGYSPFYPQLPQAKSLFGQNNLSSIQGDMDAEAKAEEEREKRKRPIGHGLYEYY